MKITLPEGVKAPLCERCGSKLEYQGSSAIYPSILNSGSGKNKQSLGNGLAQMTPVGYDDNFRCRPCRPPYVKLRRSIRSKVVTQ